MLYKLSHRVQQWRFQQSAESTPLQALYQEPFIASSRLFKDTRFLVVDCEMSGLDPRKCQLLSIGWVIIENGRIVNSSARHLLIHADKGTGDSSRFLGLLDINVAGANSAATVLMFLMKPIPGAFLVFHHAALAIRFLQ